MTHGSHVDLDPRALRDAFGTFPSGVVAVAGLVDGEPSGLAASSFTSVSLDPPLVSLCVANSSSTWPRLRGSAALGVSVLAEEHDHVCRQLAGPAADRFTDLATRESEGAVLLRDAVATFTCTIHDEIEAGDHTVVLLRLRDLGEGRGAEPLVFHRSGFARLHREDLDAQALGGRVNGGEVDQEPDAGGDHGDEGADEGADAA